MEKDRMGWRNLYPGEQKTKMKTAFPWRKAGPCPPHFSSVPLPHTLPPAVAAIPSSKERKNLAGSLPSLLSERWPFVSELCHLPEMLIRFLQIKRRSDGGERSRFAEKAFHFLEPRQDTFQATSPGTKTDMLVA